MNVLFVTFNYPPETGAGSIRTWHNVRGLRRAGHRVVVLAPLPNYPDGAVFPRWRGKSYVYDRTEQVLWTWIKPSLSPRPWSRLMPYAAYNVSGLLGALCLGLRRQRFDVVVATSPPLPAISFVVVVSVLLHIPLVLDLRDIWPDAGLLMGQLQEGAMDTRLTRCSERRLLRRSCQCVVTTPGDKDNLIRKGMASDRVSVIPNGADTDLFHPRHRLEPSQRMRRYGGGPGFSAIYCGSFNFGMNDIDALAGVAREIAEKRPDYTLFYVGSGQGLDRVKAAVQGTRHPESVRFLDPMEHTDLAPLVASCDAGFIPRKDVSDTGGSVPVKMFEFWSAGLPIALGVNDAANALHVFNRAQAGVRFPAGRVDDALAAIDRLASLNDVDRRRLGAAGREFVLCAYSRTTLADQFAEIVTGARGTRPGA